MGKLLKALKGGDIPEPLGMGGKAATAETVAAPPLPFDFTSAGTDSETIPFIEVPEIRTVQSTPAPVIITASKSETSTAVVFREVTNAVRHTSFSPAQELEIWHEPGVPATDAYRRAAEDLLRQIQDRSLRSLVVAPLSPEADLSAAVVHLSLALTEDGRRSLLLIDTAPRGRRLASLLGIAAAPGWSELLAGLAPAQAIQDTGWGRLHVVAAGNRLVGSHAAFRGERIRTLVTHLRDSYDLVLFNAPPWNETSAPATLAHACDALCFLLANAEADLPATNQRIEALQQSGLPVLGSLVVSDVSAPA